MNDLDPRDTWQQEALEQYHRDNKRDWLLSATPGSGKTRFSLKVAKDLLTQRVVDRVVVVVPTDNLRTQWADKALQEAGLSLWPADNADGGIEKDGYVGSVVTYAQVARQSDLQRRATRVKTLAIFDEVHHAGDEQSWGAALANGFEHATKRLCLTGTPWRRDNNRIPFVAYDRDCWLIKDFAYEYGRAVGDGVCRAIAFHAYDGEARWQDCGKIVQANIGQDLDERDLPAVMDTLLRPTNSWIPSLFTTAVQALNELRLEVPDAGGLVVADKQWQATEYAKILEKIDGRPPVLVISDDPGAKGKLEAFDKSEAKWLVAVNMVSEGIDIPRLAVGVYATRKKTPLTFRQVCGRFVRKGSAHARDVHNATLFIPAVPTLMTLAKEIEDELRHELQLEAEQFEKIKQQAANEQKSFELRTPLSSSEPIFDRLIRSGAVALAHDVELVKQYGIKVEEAPKVLRLLEDQLQLQRDRAGEPLADVTISPRPPAEPRFRYEKRLRDEIKTLVGKVAYRDGISPKVVNTEILEVFKVPRAKANIDTLESILEHLSERLAR